MTWSLTLPVLSAESPRRCRWLLGQATLAVCVVGLSGCTLWSGASSAPQSAAQADERVAVEAAIAQAEGVTTAPTYTGTTQPLQQVRLRSRVAAQVVQLAVDVGDAVTAGDVVAQLDPDLLTVAVNQAEAELRARQSEVAQAAAAVSDAQTTLERARVELQQAQADADRLRRLAAAGAVSAQTAEQAQVTASTAQQVLQSAQEQIRTRQAAVAAAEGRVTAQRAVLAQTQERLSYAQIESPLTGVVLSRAVEAGDYVEAGDELLQLGDLSQVKVMIDVSDRDLAQVSLGQPVAVRLDAFPDLRLSGRVSRISPAADPTARLIPVEVTLANTTGQIGSGLLARVSLQEQERDRVAIPNQALDLQADVSTPTVFVITQVEGSEATLEARSVTLGQQGDDRTEVIAGLAPGESFVVRSSRPLQDGQTVRLSILSEVAE